MDHHVSESLNGNCHQWIVDIFYVCSITTSLMMCETGNKSSKQFNWGINDQACFKRTCQIFLTSVAYLSTSLVMYGRGNIKCSQVLCSLFGRGNSKSRKRRQNVTNAKNMENPRTKRFLVELRLMNWRFDKPTAVIIPNMTQKIPPTIGSEKSIRCIIILQL